MLDILNKTIIDLLLSGEDVVSLESVGAGVGTKDLLLLALPLGLIDGIDPVLDLHDDTTVLLHVAGKTLRTLGRLDRDGAYAWLVTRLK